MQQPEEEVWLGIHQCSVDVPGITIVLLTALQAGQKCDVAGMILFSKLLFNPITHITHLQKSYWYSVDGLNME